MLESKTKDSKNDSEFATIKEHETTKFVRPPLTLGTDIINGIKYVLFNPKANLIIMPILMLLESMALKIIISNVPYTEIDYKAYMEQIDMIYDGEYNYDHIEGGTGPLVYPAGHVVIFKMMHWLTEAMDHIERGQTAYRYLYLLTLFHQFMIFYRLDVAPWCVVLSCLSKRLHSIYVLRLFNDCFTTFFMMCTFVGLIRGSSIKNNKMMKFVIITLVSVIYSFAISIKMNALLYFPGVAIGLYLISDGTLIMCLYSILMMIGMQIWVGWSFLSRYPWQYMNGAFNFKRQFMFEWSINWQFIGEDGFSSLSFQRSLLISQMTMILFVIIMKYPTIFQDISKSIIHPISGVIKRNENILDIISFLFIISNFIGIIFSRSLHYQFLTWYHWTIPILMNWSRLPIWIGPIWYIIHEYCWNSYPPNSKASTILIILNSSLLLSVLINKLRKTTINNETVPSDKKNN
ncbi:dolichyl-P-Man:Man(5)GlcNAc(2)-PP-dolichol alpha-1,3-mannosyltransferase [Maudiozyma exigua]|uniref:Dol-P-Man:Man(5)GlcNAc(2)-PP-Dol alpha-1,3-mannosyltransferase n=1 Tax=Maudiozyma exigua TaxID=34358 RepID=A0A9P6W2I4_MAUEX|nr:dolichyl-P-Man:Man(5)GlcNAc(2)-PP-dolichol alpha-1,3-mannosyltransferase [Kazachstania exigua]